MKSCKSLAFQYILIKYLIHSINDNVIILILGTAHSKCTTRTAMVHFAMGGDT